MALLFLPLWLTDDKHLTLATWGLVPVTLLLVIATAGMLLDSWQKGKEQRKRWEREDELRVEENRPKAAFWLEQAVNNDSPELWCANVGTVNFIVSGMQVNPLQGEPRRIPFSRKNCLIVPVGTMKSIELIDPEGMFGSNRPGNAEIDLIFQGPTDVKPYHLWFYNGRYVMKDAEGKFQGLLPLICPKCETLAANFHVDGMTNARQLEEEIEDVKKEFEASCRNPVSLNSPNHASSNSRVTFGM